MLDAVSIQHNAWLCIYDKTTNYKAFSSHSGNTYVTMMNLSLMMYACKKNYKLVDLEYENKIFNINMKC